MTASDEERAAAYRQQVSNRRAFTDRRIAALHGNPVAPEAIRDNVAPIRQFQLALRAHRVDPDPNESTDGHSIIN